MKKVNITRRKMIKIAAIGGGAAAVAGTLAWQQQDRIKDMQSSDVESLLKDKFDYLDLQLSNEEFDKFYRGYKMYYKNINRLWYHKARGRSESSQVRIIEELASTFLLSTDFFLNGADVKKPVRFVTLYSPYATPCYNPIAIAQRA